LNGVVLGAGFEGTQADRYDYKRYEGYVAVIRARNGKARITFNPKKLARSGGEARLTFGHPGSVEAHFSAIEDLVLRAREAYSDALIQSRMQKGASQDFAYDVSGLAASLQKQIRSEKDALLRQELWLASIAVSMLNKKSGAFPLQDALGAIPPESHIWVLDPHIISYALSHSGMPIDQQEEYVARVIEKNPSARTKTALLFDQFMAARLSDRKDLAKTYFDILTGRFGSSPEGKLVKERYTP
jgi:hypothetical protein